MTSRDTRRCCQTVRSAILATAWLLVLLLMLTPEKQNLDVLRTFGGRKYGRLDAIQNAATRPLLQCDVH